MNETLKEIIRIATKKIVDNTVDGILFPLAEKSNRDDRMCKHVFSTTNKLKLMIDEIALERIEIEKKKG